MKIQHYSHLYVAETEEQYRTRTIQRFQKLVDKRRAKGEHVVFDPDIVNNDIDRWFTQKAKGNRDIKPQLEAYKTHEELNEAMRNFKSKAEIENDLKTGDFEHEGKELVLSFGVYKVFKTRDVKALTLLAQNSNWCVRFPNAAENYLVGQKSTFYIVLRGTDRFVAIRETEENKPNVEVWWYTDYELRGGTSHAEFPADLLQEDLNAINQVLQKLGFTELVPGELFAVYPDIQTYLQSSRESGEFKRFLYNQRFYPELANSLFTPGMQISGALDLSYCTGLISLPEGFSVLNGDLDLKYCTELTSLPKDLSIPKGHLNLKSCTGLTNLPENLFVGNSINLTDCKGLTSLPENLSVRGALYLGGCIGLTRLPENLSVKNALYLTDCTGLTSLPKGLSVGMELVLKGCTGLTSLPEGLSVGGYLDLISCTGLTSLPKKLSVIGSIYLGKSGITSLPENLFVSGDLSLVYCAGLKNLPKELYVGGDLILAVRGELGSVEELPEDLTVLGNISGNSPKGKVPYQELYNNLHRRDVE